jgi:hypothetical protein
MKLEKNINAKLKLFIRKLLEEIVELLFIRMNNYIGKISINELSLKRL